MEEERVKEVEPKREGQTQASQPPLKYTNEDLKIMQAWDLDRKIQVSQTRLIEWYTKWNGKCYVSFSGGKDSTVLAYLAARVCNMLGYKLTLWFSDTGLEFPEIRSHVKVFPDWLKEKFPSLEIELVWDYPKYGKTDKVTGKKKGDRITFRDVIKKYGYPVISKNVAKYIYEARKNPQCRDAEPFNPESEYCQKYGSRYCLAKYAWLLDAPFSISHMCCSAMKKNPSKKYERTSGNKPIVGSMACESALRVTQWRTNGCNAFDTAHPISAPLSFWTEQDILQLIQKYEIPLSSIYGRIVSDDKGKLSVTGKSRTGCMLCAFGTHLDKEPNRFQQLKQTHPGVWEFAMKPYDEGGCGMAEVLDFIGVKKE